MSLQSAADCRALPVVRPAIDERMAKVRQIHDAESDAAPARASLRDSLSELSRQLAELEHLAGRGRAGSHELGALLRAHGDTRECRAELDRIDEAILAVSARSIAGFLIQSVIHGIAGEGERAPDAAEVVARSEAIYSGITESASWQRRLLDRAARELVFS
jgi:hypothetical protein